MVETLTIIALTFNFIALCIVAYQTHLNRKSIDLANRSIDDAKKTRQIQMLPRAGFILESKYHLEKYIAEIDGISGDLERAVNSRNEDLLKEITSRVIDSPKGLVDKYFYKHGPTWLSEIWLAGAQYYYDFHAPAKSLWDERESKARWGLASDILQRGKEHTYHIKQLLSYIDQMVPESYSNAPASLSDNRFIED